MTDWIGRTLSKVEVQKLLGRGGMAEVYLGRHATLNRPVAVKILHSYLAENDTLLQRFRAEAQAVAAMRHPNIVQVFDFDTVEDHPYIVMELLEGASLADYLRGLRRAGRTLPPETAARLVAALAAALDYAHARGIVHRDVKPANVILRRGHGALDPEAPLPPDAEPVLTDFGVARMADAATRTTSGAISGTPAYMSPEQARGETVDARSDIYSLGVMLYEMLAGQRPFGVEDETAASLLVKHISVEPPPISNLSPVVQAVVNRALAKDREQRYQKAGDLAADLLDALNLPTPTGMTVTRAAVAAPTTTRPRVSGRAVNRTAIVAAALGLIVLAAGALLSLNLFSKRGSGAASAEVNFGTLGFRDGTSEVDEASLAAVNLPRPSAGTQYEAWLLGENGEKRVSLGVLNLDADGRGQITFLDSEGRNLLAGFDSFEITVEPNPDSDPGPSATIVFSSILPPQALVHIRHLLVAFSAAPDQIGLAVGLERQAKSLDAAAQAMLAAQQLGDVAAMKRSAEGMVNLIEGSNGADFGDLDGDGAVFNPGDGFGLLLNGENIGYIQGALQHAKLGSQTPDATAHIQLHAGHVVVAAQNVADWAVQSRDLALKIVAAKDTNSVADQARQAAELADRLLNGQDLNGNEIIDPLPGEGGALTVYQHAQYMADMFLLPGANQMPTAAPPATEVPAIPGYSAGG